MTLEAAANQLIIIEQAAASVVDTLLDSVVEAVDASSSRLLQIFVLPCAELGLLDCLELDAEGLTASHDVAKHLQAVGLRPVWRRGRGSVDGKGARQAVCFALRSRAADKAARDSQSLFAIALHLSTAGAFDAGGRPSRRIISSSRGVRAATQAGFA